MTMIEEFDPNLVFINLGDVDRRGTPTSPAAASRCSPRVRLRSGDTDLQVGRFVTLLKDSGRWQNSVVIVLADHSMDWSDPDRRSST